MSMRGGWLMVYKVNKGACSLKENIENLLD